MNLSLKIQKRIFNDCYYPYLFDKTRTLVFYGGAGSGKSHFIAQKLLIKALKSKRKVLVIRKFLASQRESCWKLFLQILSDFHISSYAQINRSEYTITLPNGSTILFKGLDDPEKIKSIVGITDIWCEEATELNEEDYDQLLLRLRANAEALQMIVSFNPISKANWVYKRWFQQREEGAKVVKTTYKDNRFLPADYIKALERMVYTNPTYYRIYALGEFATLDKLVYPVWREAVVENPTGEYMVGLDFGFANDPTALVGFYMDVANKRIYIDREWSATGKTNPEIAAAIKSLGLIKAPITADSAEPKSIEELKRAGINRIQPSVKGPDSIKHGIQKLQQFDIVVHPRCEGVIAELQNYTWKKDKKTGEYTNEPIDCFNHFMDALRYGTQGTKLKLKTLNKGLLGL